ncbi:hypothetical protein [Endozoicomonas sp. GU-1]|uniref:hypothetical protein n=1 Tax=Endozoicomonas sp. GU-1 TaxID=3009078 RepID=UPI0022B3FEB7|nr:hypothetical protein [Endozoicomonas sp. GU-1]WBA79811.1 hypothetical protein O2T12_15735 [Endozoicomonas sp. GU-1]WBA87389.1 hypothetical protein O3276_04985 [Endozoicomonas sp. GU-1]
MLTAPTTQNIHRSMTDPKACVDVGHDYGSLVGCGFGIYKGIQVTGCSGTQYVGYAMQCINKGCLAMSSAKGVDACCTLTVKACGCYCITGAMAMAGGLAGGLVDIFTRTVSSYQPVLAKKMTILRPICFLIVLVQKTRRHRSRLPTLRLSIPNPCFTITICPWLRA